MIITKNNIFNKVFFFLISMFLSNFLLNSAYTVEPDEILGNYKYEERAREISKNIRCMVCQNQSIDDSVSPLAKDLRILIRKKILEGKSDKEIYKFFTDRYGDFILLKPSFKINTIFLWFMPLIFLIIGLLIVFDHSKKFKNKN
mgnify:CR=1 FL=1